MNNNSVCNGIINWIVPFLSICILDPLLNFTLFSVVKCKGDVSATLKRHLTSRLHWATRFAICHQVNMTLHCASITAEHALFLFGWPPCQRSDMTLVEVSQHAYNCLFIRTIVLFVFLRNSCEPDMVLVYFCWINSVWVWVWNMDLVLFALFDIHYKMSIEILSICFAFQPFI